MEIDLQKFERKDIEQLISWIPSKKFLLQFAGSMYKYPLTSEQLEEDIIKMETTKEILMLKAVDKELQETIGHVQLIKMEHLNITVIGRVLVGDEKYRGKGIGFKIINETLHIAFNELGLKKIYLRVYDFNVAAIKCYEKAGFKVIKKQENVEKIDGEYWNALVMELSYDKYLKFL